MSKKTNKRGGFRKRSKTLAKLRQNNGGMPGKEPLASQSEDYEEFHEDQDNRRLAKEIELEKEEEREKKIEKEKAMKLKEEEERQENLEEDREVWERYYDEDAKKELDKMREKYGTKPEKNNWRAQVKDWWNNRARQSKGGSQKRRRQNKRKSSKNRSR